MFGRKQLTIRLDVLQRHVEKQAEDLRRLERKHRTLLHYLGIQEVYVPQEIKLEAKLKEKD